MTYRTWSLTDDTLNHAQVWSSVNATLPLVGVTSLVLTDDTDQYTTAPPKNDTSRRTVKVAVVTNELSTVPGLAGSSEEIENYCYKNSGWYGLYTIVDDTFDYMYV